MMTQAGTNCEGVYLCEKCSVLRFDDKKLGGYQGVSRTGQPEFRFDALSTKKWFALDYCHNDELPNLPGLQSSAQNGCIFCRVLRDAIHGLKLSKKQEIQVRLEYIWKLSQSPTEDVLDSNCRNGLYWLVAQMFTRNEPSHTEDCTTMNFSHSVLFWVEAGSKNVASWFQLPPESKQEVLCQENIAMLKKHVDSCVQNVRSANSSFFPTRLLDLEASDTSDGIRLVLTKSLNLEDKPRYAALSYCWGSKLDAEAQLKTENATLKDRMASILWNSLPRTIQDAITVTRCLSIRYLWIDALCIVQGDLRDWESESSHMGTIYAHAIPTICSLVTSSCRESFLGRSQTIKIGFRSSIAPEVHGYFHLRHHPISQDPELIGPIKRFRGELALDKVLHKWGQRAWTLQEYQFSKVVLLFGTSRTYVVNPYHTIAEPFEIGGNDGKNQIVIYQTGKPSICRFERHRHVDIEIMYNEWLELLTEYSERQSTLLEDKLPAISGLANYVAQKTGDIYIAGIWKGDLLRGLLWEDTDQSEHRKLSDYIQATTSPKLYIAPSWSWASRGKVLFPLSLLLRKNNIKVSLGEHDFQSECTNLLAMSVLDELSRNPFGRIKYAIIRLSGKLGTPTSKLCPVQRKIRVQQLWSFGFSEHYTAFCDLNWNCSNMDEMAQSRVKLLLLASTLGRSVEDVMDFPADDEGIESRQRRAQGSKFNKVEADDENRERRNAWGLLIHPTGELGKYIRVGGFSCRIEQGGMEAFEETEYQDVELV